MYYQTTPFGEAGARRRTAAREHLRACPNPLIWYAGVAAVLYLAYRFVVARDWRYALVLTGVAVTYVPWLLYPERTIFQFYTVAILPFMLLALTFALRDIAGARHADTYRRHDAVSGSCWCSSASRSLLSAFWYPVVTGDDRCRTTSGACTTGCTGWI